MAQGLLSWWPRYPDSVEKGDDGRHRIQTYYSVIERSTLHVSRLSGAFDFTSTDSPVLAIALLGTAVLTTTLAVGLFGPASVQQFLRIVAEATY